MIASVNRGQRVPTKLRHACQDQNSEPEAVRRPDAGSLCFITLRWKNQYVPAAITTTDPAITIFLAAAGRRARIAPRSEATINTMIAWPISTPRLNENSDRPSARGGSPVSRSTLANPNP